MNQFSTAFYYITCCLLTHSQQWRFSGRRAGGGGGGGRRGSCAAGQGDKMTVLNKKKGIVCSNSLNCWDKLKVNSINNRFYKFMFTLGAAIVITHPDRQKHLSTSLLLSPLFPNTSGLWSIPGRLTPHPLLDNVNTELVLSVFNSTPYFHSHHSVFTEKLTT
jgi:hypothetical protein